MNIKEEKKIRCIDVDAPLDLCAGDFPAPIVQRADNLMRLRPDLTEAEAIMSAMFEVTEAIGSLTTAAAKPERAIA